MPTNCPKNDQKEIKTPGWITGAFTGGIGTAATFHIDMLQTRIQAGKPTGLFAPTPLSNKIFNVLLKPFMVNYHKIAAIKIFRYSITYLVTPEYKRLLHNYVHMKDEKKSKIIADAAAGITDATISGPLSVWKQLALTKTAEEATVPTYKLLSLGKFAKSSVITTLGLMPRYGLFWPTFQYFLETGENALNMKEEKPSSKKKLKEFLIGSAAGILATTIYYPLDAISKQRVAAIQQGHYQSLSQFLGTAFKNQRGALSVGAITKVCFRGLPLSVPLMFFSGGANNFAVHAADDFYRSIIVPRL